MAKKTVYSALITSIILVIFLASDLSYSFLQYLHTPLDGDLAGGVLPTTYDVQKIFDDPLGFQAILNGTPHPNPNRYFAHLVFRDYFQNIPFLWQKFMSPIESIYFSNAIIKILIHCLLLYLLSSMISGTHWIFNKKWLLAAVLVTSLFQTNDYSHYMGIIDNSITYFFFYALPLSFLIWFYSYFYKTIYHQKKANLSIFSKGFLTILAIILPLSGPLIPSIVLIVSLLVFIYFCQKSLIKKSLKTPFQFLKTIFQTLPKNLRFFFILITIISLYSIWLGSYNSNFQEGIPTLSERYARLPQGIYYQFTQKLGYPILFLYLVINVFLIKRYAYHKEGKKIIKSFKWVGLFTLLFIFLLPLGGYRPYRPNILRFDVIAPITICFVYLFGISTFYLLQRISKYKVVYGFITVIFLFIFTNADIDNLHKNECEKHALQTISDSEEMIVPLSIKCEVMSWGLVTDPQLSGLNADVLQFWGITKERKLYFHKQAIE